MTGRRRVPGLRREEVASLAGIGVSWYTSLENGDADGVSEATLSAVADVLRLSESEREYLLALAGHLCAPEASPTPGRAVRDTMHAIAFPAYIITADWIIVDCNVHFRRVWGIGEDELPFNAVDRLFLDPRTRKMHGSYFIANLTPIIAMLHSSLGRRPTAGLRALVERLVADREIRAVWDDYNIESPLLPNTVTIESLAGTFRYETLTLPIPSASGASYAVVVQVPDDSTRRRLEM